MAEPRIKNEEFKVEEIEYAFGELRGLMKENYITGIELSLSMYNENARLLQRQMESWFALQHDYADLMKEFLRKFPAEGMGLQEGSLKNPFAAQVDWYLSLQNSYYEFLRNTLDKFPKEAASMGQKNIESAFSVFDNFLSLFEGFGRQGVSGR
ncbi:MAG TPA: hypothetical protein VLB01_05005 [Thermodesulfobacteriota bacterium]|nr:hypothetical protein [Thermodesulfobacteriota bacterium]